MKTYIINTLQKHSAVNRSLNFVSTIKASEWIVFNDNKDVSEKLVFEKESLLDAINGQVCELNWRFVKVSDSLIIEDGSHKCLYKIVEYTKDIVVLNIDSTNNYCFLINSKSALKFTTFEDIQWYLANLCGIDILNEEQRELFLKNRENEYNEKRKKEIAAEDFDKALDNAFKIIIIPLIIIIFIAILVHRYFV